MSNKLTAQNAKPSDWRAWINVMPGSAPTLHVLGDIDMGNESDGATLSFDCLEKIMPPNLVLRIGLKTIFIPRPKGETRVTLHYTHPFAPGQVGAVVIVYPDGTHLRIDQIGIAT